ncbi:MAG: ImmA/IrrE family metallo-endopeptidase [Lachnospiraceae bacterium]|nr:ImmA/IrrE family metallo-endopeptidase [Lachnospiraceae bacterium]
MSRLYVYQKIGKLVRKHGTRDPFELLDAMHVQVRFYFDLHSTKGFSRYFLRQYFVGINGNLPREQQRIVAAHELGHIVLHAQALRNSPLFDTAVYDKRSSTEYEANLFAADLLLRDEDVMEAAGGPETDLGSLCLSLGAEPGLMSFKLRSMYARGLGIPLLTECDSRFLARQ